MPRFFQPRHDLICHFPVFFEDFQLSLYRVKTQDKFTHGLVKCRLVWSERWSDRENDRPQVAQLNGLTPVCLRK